jgi:Flp pilus assembly protein TadG
MNPAPPVRTATSRPLRFRNPGFPSGFPGKHRTSRPNPSISRGGCRTRGTGPNRRPADPGNPAGRPWLKTLLRSDRGNAAVELAPVALILLLFLGLLIAGGRLTVTRMAVNDAARDAARQASIARTPGEAQAAALQSASAALRADGLDCTPAVSVNTSGFAVPVGEPAQVSATVTCDVRLSDLTAVPGMPGSRSLTATFTSPLDPYRAR